MDCPDSEGGDFPGFSPKGTSAVRYQGGRDPPSSIDYIIRTADELMYSVKTN
jgi:hypothetical protein